MWSKIKSWFGIYNLRSECAKKVNDAMGKEAEKDFLILYDAINSGTPVSFIEATTVIQIVEETKSEMRAKSLFGKMFLAKKEQA